jgi:protein TonB
MLGNAPDLGVTISPDSGLSGECLRTGVVVRCENTELDPRVDREVCRALNLRSVVVVPVTVDSYSVAGLLEVFSSRPHAFSGRHVLLLRQIAELISAVTSKHSSRAPSSDSATEAPTEQLEPDHTPSAPAPAEAPAPIPAAEASSPSPKPSPVVCDVCGFENLPIDRDCQNCDVPLPTALDDPLSFTVEAPPPPEVCEVIRPVRAAQSAPHSFSSLMMWFLLGVVIAVSAFAVVRWRYNQPTHAAQGSVELSPILNTAVEASSRPEPVPASSVTPAATTAAPAPKPKPSPKQTREPEVPVREAKLPSTPQPQPAPSAPDSLALVSASKLDSPLVAVLSAPAAAPRWVIASSAPVPARLVHRIEPVYPKAAMARHIEGTVVLHAIVTHKGAVHSVTVVKGNDLLAQAAVQAVKQWRYSPAQLDGQPVDADANITISFSLAR